MLLMKLQFFLFYLDAIRNAAGENNIELIYILLIELSKNNTSEIFRHCNFLKLIALPPNIKEIGYKSFYYCSNLVNISIPSSVTIIGDFAFYSCSSLMKIKIPFSVTKIGKHAFDNCSSLKKISIPSSVVSIGQSAFSICKVLEQISIPFSITSIDDYTFSNCSSLKSISLPSSIHSIGQFAFYSCDMLKRVVFYPPIKNNITEPTSNTSSLKSIGEHAFSQCISLREIEFPPSIKHVGNNAFENCPFLDEKNDDDGGGVGGTYALVFYFLILIAFTLTSFIAVFITTVVWWSRIHPYFQHGYKTGKIVYISLETSLISTLVLTIYAFLHLLLSLIINNRLNRSFTLEMSVFYKKCSKVLNCASIAIYVTLLLIVFISAIVASSYALKNKKRDGVSVKCLEYIFDGLNGAKDWVTNQSLEKQNDFKNWESNLLEKAYGKDGKVTNYYCLTVGLPIIIFSVIPFIVTVILFTLLRLFS